MADSNTDGDGAEQQITFNIKSSSDAKHVVTVPVSMTVGDLKQKISTPEYVDTPPERQRLIYSGRVLKDTDTIATSKIKDGNTVHLVKSAASNQRQNPASQGGAAVPPGAGQPASNVPTNIAAGTGAGDPLAQLTGARYAGFHGLPGADMFGADGGMGAPPNADQMLRMLDDPNFAQQMNEAMNNPAVLNMLRNSPMLRDNPMARAAIDNPEMRRMLMNPDMIRMQMQMQRAMGGDAAGGGGAFPMPGQTDTTEGGNSGTTASENTSSATGTQSNPPNPFGGAGAANPFAALFPGVGGNNNAAGTTPGTDSAGAGAGAAGQQNPFGSLFGGAQGGESNPMNNMMQQMMQNPEMMQNAMRMMGAMGGGAGGAGGEGAFNPFGGFGGFGGAAQEPQAPADTRPIEERFADQLRSLNDMGFYDFERNVQALRRSGGSVQGAVEYLLSN